MTEAEPAGMRPVFIGGCMRSGTTLLGSVLGGHSQVVCVPEARFIHMIRDGRAVANSMLRVRFGPRTTHHAARKWVFEVAFNFAVQQIKNQPERFFNIWYEEFIIKSEDSLQAICQFIGIPYEPALTEKQGYAVPVNNARSHRLVGQPPDPARISSWQRELSTAEISIFEKQARDMLVLTGYEPVSAPESITPVQKLRWIVLAGLSRRIFKHRASRQARQAADGSSG